MTKSPQRDSTDLAVLLCNTAESAIATDSNDAVDSLSEAGEVAAVAKRHWNQSRQLKRSVDTSPSPSPGPGTRLQDLT